MSDASSGASKRAKSGADETTQQLEARLAALREDMDEIVKAIASKAEKHVSDAADAFTSGPAEHLIGELRDAVSEIRRKTDEAERKVVETAREHPLQALLIAFGLGFLVSLLLRR